MREERLQMLIPSLFFPKQRHSEHMSSKSMGMLMVLINYLERHWYAIGLKMHCENKIQQPPRVTRAYTGQYQFHPAWQQEALNYFR